MFTYVWFIESWGDLLVPSRRCTFHSKSVISEGQIENGNTGLRSSGLTREMWQHISSILRRKLHFYLSEMSGELSLNLPRFCCRTHCSKFVVLCPHKRRVVTLHLCGARKGKAKQRRGARRRFVYLNWQWWLRCIKTRYCKRGRSPGFAGEDLSTYGNHFSCELFHQNPKASAAAKFFSFHVYPCCYQNRLENHSSNCPGFPQDLLTITVIIVTSG